MRRRRTVRAASDRDWAASAAASALSAAAAWGEEVYGHAVPGQIGFQPPVTDLARYLQWFHNDILMPIIVGISLFVLALLIYVVWRFSEKRQSDAVAHHP